MKDSFLTLARSAQDEIKIKGSRFIGEAYPVKSVEDAKERLEEVRKREHAATHHCYAWQVGLEDKAEFKYSDDGEPNGTAGKPIYDVILGTGITNVIVVVTRYFGGTKLGTGGLTRAYSEAAKGVLEKAPREEIFLKRTFKLTMAFSLYDQWQKAMHQLEAGVIDSEFTDSVTLTVSIRLSRAEELKSKFTELTSGQGQLEEILDKS